MKLIPLTRGQFAQVDDEDYDYLIQFNWQVQPRKYKGKLYGYYAQRTLPRVNKIQKFLPMHRELMNASGRWNLVDHKDGDTLNNQKSNLRMADSAQNAWNRKSIGKSKYKGVNYNHGKYKSVHKDGTIFETNYPVWRSFLRSKGKIYILGRFPYTPEGEIAAAKAYDEAAKEHFREFAVLNFKY